MGWSRTLRQCTSPSLAKVSYQSLPLTQLSSVLSCSEGARLCFDLACWGKSSLILFHRVVEPALTAVCAHTSNQSSFFFGFSNSFRDAALGEKGDFCLLK